MWFAIGRFLLACLIGAGIGILFSTILIGVIEKWKVRKLEKVYKKVHESNLEILNKMDKIQEQLTKQEK